MEQLNNLPILFFANSTHWLSWLEEHHTSQEAGIWLKFAKKNTGITSLTYDEALDGALCYGWIDGQAKTYDTTYYLQKFTPRRAKSIWSKRNVTKALQFIADDKMKPSGLAAINAAKADGRWEQAYDSPNSMQIPPDFQAALHHHPKAKTFFESLNKTNAYAFLFRIQTAKRAETRAKRIALFIQMLEEGKKFH